MDNMTPAEQIRLILRRKDLKITDLAALTGQSRQNLTNKLARDDFQVSELKTIADALNCDLSVILTQRD